MRLLIYILFLSLSASAQNIQINGSGSRVNINGSGTTLAINPYFRENIPIDNGYYSGFPMIADATNNGKETFGIYKLSFNHAGGGPLMLIHTTNWGQTWTEDSIEVDETVIHSTNHGFYRYASGRMVIAYKKVGETSIRFAYNDTNDSSFYSSASVVTPGTNYSVLPSPIKMQESSYGSLIFAYYQVGSSGNPNSAELMESLDSGVTWSHKATIYTSNDTYPTGFPNSRGNEIALCETHPTGNETTSKWMAMIRPEVANDGGGYYMVYRSADGANTWSQDLTTVAGSFVDDNGNTVPGNFSKSGLYLFLSSNSPLDIKLVGDSVYVVNGNRNITHGYGLVYLTATPDSAWSNGLTSWTRHPYVMEYYSGPGTGSSTDCGYDVLFTSGNNIFTGQYDVSTLSPLPSVSRRCLIRTVKIR